MAIRLIDYDSPDYSLMIALRYQLLRKPLGLNFNDDELKAETDDILIGCFDEDKLEGCCLLTKTDTGTVRLRQMAVVSGLQGKGIGRALLQFAENIARDRGFKKITMHARKTATGFYEKLGYKITGTEFKEVTIPHFIMEKYLDRDR